MKPNKIKIVFVINSLSIGGSEKVLIQSCNNLDFDKYEPSLVVLSLPDPDNSIFKITRLKQEIPVKHFDYTFNADYSLMSYLKLAYFKTSSKQILKVANHINSLDPDIVHFHSSPRELVIQKYLKGSPSLIFTDHVLRVNGNEYGFVKTKILTMAFSRLYFNYNVIAVSASVLTNLRKFSILDPHKNHILIENCIETPSKSTCEKSENEPLIIIYVARISEVKGHRELLEASHELKKKSNFKLLILGPDEMNGSMQKLAKELGIEDNVLFTGAVNKVQDYLQKADIAVFPSHKEGLPLALLEKMANSLPIVASDIPELSSVLTKDSALFFPLGDSKKLFLCLNDLASNPELRKRLGQKANAIFRERFSCKRNAELLDNFYKSVVNS